MRGLADAGSSHASPRCLAVVALAVVLTLTLLLPDRQHLSAWPEAVSNTFVSSVNSVYGYMGWKPLPVDYFAESDEGGSERLATSPMRFNTSLPVCTRTWLFPFESTAGFMGTLGLLVRASVVAESLGYSLLIDDENWIYGRWTDYFQPYEPDCMPADDWQDRSKRVEIAAATDEAWRRADHVWGPLSVSYLDRLTLDRIMPDPELDKIHRMDLKMWPPVTPIASNDTVPAFFVDAFNTQAKWLQRFWRLSPLLDRLVHEERNALGWDIEGWDERPRSDPSDVVIGAHVRMGDKCYETNALKAGPLRFAAHLLGHATHKTMHGEKCTPDGKLVLDDEHAQNYFRAAAAEVNAVLSEHSGRGVPAEPDYDTTRWGDSKPTLLIMSDEEAVLQVIKQHAGSKVFRILHTVNAQVPGLAHGFDRGDFFALSIEDRVKATRPMIRDMELLSRHAGGLVFMSISNVGRILALLAGLHEVHAGRIMAVDNRWFPTCFFN